MTDYIRLASLLAPSIALPLSGGILSLLLLRPNPAPRPQNQLVMLPAVNQRLIDLDEVVKKQKDALETPARKAEVDALYLNFAKYNPARAAMVFLGGVVGVRAALGA
ncbi:hypothetical protein JCM8547_002901 [Rhodosporidiobolus lusitaniae]